jgi:hypothetical protein
MLIGGDESVNAWCDWPVDHPVLPVVKRLGAAISGRLPWSQPLGWRLEEPMEPPIYGSCRRARVFGVWHHAHPGPRASASHLAAPPFHLLVSKIVSNSRPDPEARSYSARCAKTGVWLFRLLASVCIAGGYRVSTLPGQHHVFVVVISFLVVCFETKSSSSQVLVALVFLSCDACLVAIPVVSSFLAKKLRIIRFSSSSPASQDDDRFEERWRCIILRG